MNFGIVRKASAFGIEVTECWSIAVSVKLVRSLHDIAIMAHRIIEVGS